MGWVFIIDGRCVCCVVRDFDVVVVVFGSVYLLVNDGYGVKVNCMCGLLVRGAV